MKISDEKQERNNKRNVSKTGKYAIIDKYLHRHYRKLNQINKKNNSQKIRKIFSIDLYVTH